MLDEVHRLIEDKNIIFYLTGSSARKLKKDGTNLLAGRALSKKMFGLSLKEIGHTCSIQSLLFSGSLPKAVTESNADQINDFLFTYVETYLKEEVFQEGLTRNLNEFSKFIEVAGQYHGQIVNLANLSREIGKSGDTIKSWFQILQDTLIGHLIEPYPLKIAAKETKHPRFYYFDCGVARAAQGISAIEEIPEQRGFYLETIILNEIKIYLEVRRKKYKIFYYSISSLGDLDFIIETKKKSHIRCKKPSEFIWAISALRAAPLRFFQFINLLMSCGKVKFFRGLAVKCCARSVFTQINLIFDKKRKTALPINGIPETDVSKYEQFKNQS